MRSLRHILLAMTLVVSGVGANDIELQGPYTGESVQSVLQSLREQGLPLAWSSNLLPTDLPVLAEPDSADPVSAVREILEPHNLTLVEHEGMFLVVRIAEESAPVAETGSLLIMVRHQDASVIDAQLELQSRPQLPAPDDLGSGVFQYRVLQPGLYEFVVNGAGYQTATRDVRIRAGQASTLNVRLQPGPAELETLTVSTSRYVLMSNSQFFIDQRAIQNLPDIGEDPIRSVHRLPGTAAGGWSARSHFRGGEENETSIYLNGLQLLDPFHVRDFHNVFSSIDARTISGVEAYTGGFPAVYGDRMSGILLLQSQRPEEPRRYEIGISVFNTSFLASGYDQSGRLDWLFSARRSNLDLVLDKKDHGEPSYNDLFAELGYNLSPRTRFTFNVQRAEDGVLVITENKPEEQEFSDSDTLNENIWVQVENQWSPTLFSQTVLSYSEFSNERDAVANDPEQLVGRVRDDREVEILGLRQDWGWDLSDAHLLKWGFDLKKQDATYHYESVANYFGAYLLFPGIPDRRVRNITAAPEGNAYSLYLADRWMVTPYTTVDVGLRWDKQTWLGPASGSQLSPRVSLLHSLNESTDLRVTWGKYHQSQGIHELQVEDGVEHFWPAQESDHLIAGLTYRWPSGISVRVEAFNKDYADLRPRFENLLDPLPLIAEFEVDRIRVAPESGKSTGFEVTVEHDREPDLSWWASYGWSRVTDRIDGRSESRNWDQRHSFQAGVAWQPEDWEIGAAVKVHSGWPTTAAFLVGEDEDDLRIEFGPRNAENLNTFFNLDVRIARDWEYPDSRLTAFLEISNLTNRENDCCVDYDLEFDEEEEDAEPEFERSVDHWLGITPSIGILWEF